MAFPPEPPPGRYTGLSRRYLMRKLPLSILLLAPLLAVGIYACDQGTPAEPELNVDGLLAASTQNRNPLFGTWMMTSAVVGDEELLARGGLQYIMTLRSDGTHSVSLSNDVLHLVCPTQTSCAWDGGYSYTATTITTVEPSHPDPDERGEDTSAYVFCGGRLIFMDSDGEVGMRLTFQRTGLGR
jgi:hypothetical protein